MQWLRHTRYDPPSIAEQQQDMVRQDRMKVLASQADARWASKPSALDSPDKQQPMQMLQSRDPDSGVTQMNADQEVRDRAEPPRTLEEQEAKPQSAVEESTPQDMPRDPPVPASSDAAPSTQAKRKTKKEPKESAWGQAEAPKDWQPQGWSPAPARRRG
jgi:NADH dehydrogenase [ubiquinone] 1 alpha subcomplex assembly factor 2